MLCLSWCLEMKYSMLRMISIKEIMFLGVMLPKYSTKQKKKINCRKPLVVCAAVQHTLPVFSAIIENFRSSQSSKLPRGNPRVS